MKILLTNDDGIRGEGLWALARAFRDSGHSVTITAPFNQQSGMAHGLSVLREVEYKRLDCDFEAWAFDGTPTDCVKIFLEGVTSDKFDVLISGINDGANLATDVLYSGTVGAAMEGFLHDIKSLAVSRDKDSVISFERVASATVDYLQRFVAMFDAPILHNINFPKNFRADVPEFVSTRLGRRDYINAFTSRTDDAGRTYFHIGGEVVDLDDGAGTDIDAVNRGLVSVTPMHTDATAYDSIPILRDIFRG